VFEEIVYLFLVISLIYKQKASVCVVESTFPQLFLKDTILYSE